MLKSVLLLQFANFQTFISVYKLLHRCYKHLTLYRLTKSVLRVCLNSTSSEKKNFYCNIKNLYYLSILNSRRVVTILENT